MLCLETLEQSKKEAVSTAFIYTVARRMKKYLAKRTSLPGNEGIYIGLIVEEGIPRRKQVIITVVRGLVLLGLVTGL